jgi:hypothetical protein
VSLGNTVLVGHLTGLAGNVFAHLDQLHTGDEITAISRGLPYKFVVSEIFESANNDPSPMLPSDDPRLTLMTCAGIWNPITHDYSKRLWVVAEPPDQAQIRIANSEATATATEVIAEATATQVAAEATATAEAMPTPTPSPTPFTGQVSLPGGIANTRTDLEHAFGMATGETPGDLVVFKQSGREEHVRFTPDPPRASTIVEFFYKSISFDAALAESRKLFTTDTRPRSDKPDGNSVFIVERFTSPTLGLALGNSGDFSIVYWREGSGEIAGLVIGPGDDIGALLDEARR